MEESKENRERESQKPGILVSACFLKERCKYSGGMNEDKAVRDFLTRFADSLRVLPVCPEVMGGLSTPRPPAEILGERVVTREGEDVTASFRKGADLVWEIARREECQIALLKARSPSCGSKAVYDGTFSGRLIKGEGLTASLLRHRGVRVFDENSLDILERLLRDWENKSGEEA